jgi:hypothetical protein
MNKIKDNILSEAMFLSNTIGEIISLLIKIPFVFFFGICEVFSGDAGKLIGLLAWSMDEVAEYLYHKRPDKLEDLANIYKQLSSIYKQNEQAITWWLKDPLGVFDNRSAEELLFSGQSKRVIDVLAEIESGFVF